MPGSHVFSDESNISHYEGATNNDPLGRKLEPFQDEKRIVVHTCFNLLLHLFAKGKMCFVVGAMIINACGCQLWPITTLSLPSCSVLAVDVSPCFCCSKHTQKNSDYTNVLSNLRPNWAWSNNNALTSSSDKQIGRSESQVHSCKCKIYFQEMFSNYYWSEMIRGHMMHEQCGF